MNLKSLHYSLIYFSLLCLNYRVIFSVTISQEPLKILYIYPWQNTMPGGLTNCVIAQAQTFAQKKSLFAILGFNRTYVQKKSEQNNLPFECFSNRDGKNLHNDVIHMYQKYGIEFVITPRWQDLPILKKAAERVPIKIILNRVATLQEDNFKDNFEVLRRIDGVVAHPDVIQAITEYDHHHHLGITNIAQITPFWNEKACLDFSSSEPRSQYFKRRYNFDIDGNPIICTIANFANPCKNHPLLFQAMAKIIHEKKFIFHAMIAGGGRLKKSLEQLAQDLGISAYVHFLGTIDDPQALLHHCDMHVLPSYYESFSLANLEAAGMKKAIICARDIETSHFIIDGITGLLFKNNNLDDLIEKLEYALHNLPKVEIMGQNGYEHVKAHYSNDALYHKWKEFLDILISKGPNTKRRTTRPYDRRNPIKLKTRKKRNKFTRSHYYLYKSKKLYHN